jgi:4-hydroxybenzoate polyprenyltransferase
MNHLAVAATMLRYRIASLLLPFFLLAPAFHQSLHEFRWQYVAGVIALCSCYVVATSLNDIFDLEIDRINHAAARDRPLVTGQASRRQLLAVALTASVVALIAGWATAPVAAALVAVSLTLNVLYSVPPVRLCARALAAPPMLAFAYVALPYGMGLAAAGLEPGALDARVAVCFAVLFAGRMLLKDFRDRTGDAKFGKHTFLLSYGKAATLLATLTCILVGDALLVTVLPAVPVLLLVIEAYFVAITVQLYRLWQAGESFDESVAIALGARMGNGVVMTLLGSLLLIGAGASEVAQASFVVAIAILFWFAYLVRPQQSLAAYRG